MEVYPSELVAIAFAAMLAPLLAELPTRFRMPVVVLEIVLGILIGPHLLNLASPEGAVARLSDFGLTFLLFMVGMEIDFDEIRGRPLTLAFGGWVLSLVTAMVCIFLFNSLGLIQTPPLIAGTALSTTALGILAPILRDRGELNSSFGKYMIAAAAAGEFGPLMIISMLLIPTHSTVIHTFFVVVFIGIALATAYFAINARSIQMIQFLSQTMQSSGQLPVRICILLLVLLATLAVKLGVNIVIGAFVAGMVVSLSIKGQPNQKLLKDKLDAIGYGFLIPIFFIVAGMKFDVNALWAEPLAPVEVALLCGLLVVVRGAPVFLYKNELKPDEKLPFALYSATGLPLIVIISEFGVSSGWMPSDKASLLVCAGMISVFLFPVLAVRLRGKWLWP